MAKVGAWIGGILGWMASGPMGLFVGMCVGLLFDVLSSKSIEVSYEEQPNPMQGDRNSFLFSLLVMASYIIKADSKIMHSEMEAVRNMLRSNFGEAAVEQGNDILLRIFEKSKDMSDMQYRQAIQESCRQIARNMDYSARLQLLNFLVLIAQADGSKDQAEIVALKEAAQWMGLSPTEVDALLHLEGDSLDDAYKVLGVSPQATDDEVRRAYRRLALEHHPDRVAKLGDDVRRAAEKKFQEINAAKERIYKARGL